MKQGFEEGGIGRCNRGLGEVDESYDAGKLEVNDFFNYATKSKDVFAGSTPRTKTILAIAKSRLYLISDAIQQ